MLLTFGVMSCGTEDSPHYHLLSTLLPSGFFGARFATISNALKAGAVIVGALESAQGDKSEAELNAISEAMGEAVKALILPDDESEGPSTATETGEDWSALLGKLGTSEAAFDTGT